MGRFRSIRHIAFAILFSLVMFCSGIFVMDVHADEAESNDPYVIEINGIDMTGKKDWRVDAPSEKAKEIGLSQGSIYYTVKTATLTLDNATVIDTGEDEYSTIEFLGDEFPFTREKQLTVKLIGDNTIIAPEIPIGQQPTYGLWLYSAHNAYIKGPGTLNIDASKDTQKHVGIRTEEVGKLTIEDGATINIAMNSQSDYGIYCENYLLIQGGSKVTVSGNPDIGIWFEKTLTIDDSTVEVTGRKAAVWDDYGIVYDADGVSVNNGTLKATATGEGHDWSYAIYTAYESHWHKGPGLKVSGDSEVYASAHTALTSEYPGENYLEIDPNGNTLRLELYDTSLPHDYYQRDCTENTKFIVGKAPEKAHRGLYNYPVLHIYKATTSNICVELNDETLTSVTSPARVQVNICDDWPHVAETLTLDKDKWFAYSQNIQIGSGVSYLFDVKLFDENGNDITSKYHVNDTALGSGRYVITVCGGSEDLKHVPVTVDWQLNDGAEKPYGIMVTMQNDLYADVTKTLSADSDWQKVFDCYEAQLQNYSLRVDSINANNDSSLYHATVTGSAESGGYVIVVTGGPMQGAEAATLIGGCYHVYEWETYKAATSTDDGEMRYRCKYCGDVQYSVPVTAYYTFNKETQEKVLKSEQGATVKVQTPWFISFHEMVYKALQERPDVTLVVDYKNGDALYEMTIPAGSGDQLQGLFGDSQFAGFLYLGGTYATTELPKDTVFDGISATEMWFGTTTAH